MATIWHYSQRNAQLIDAGRLDGSAWWPERLDGFTRRQAELAVNRRYGRATHVDRTADSTTYRFAGFMLRVE